MNLLWSSRPLVAVPGRIKVNRLIDRLHEDRTAPRAFQAYTKRRKWDRLAENRPYGKNAIFSRDFGRPAQRNDLRLLARRDVTAAARNYEKKYRGHKCPQAPATVTY